MRIAVAGFQHETNTFAPLKATWDDFVRPGGWPGLTRSADIPPTFAGMNIPIAGFMKEAMARGHTLVPIVWCTAVPSAHVTAETFERVAAMIVAGLVEAMAGGLDAVYLDLHGAMVTEHLEDGEGELLARVRHAVGAIPVVNSLDLHANVTEQMVANSDLMIAYRTYPHVDMAETGGRVAAALDDILRGRKAKPKKSYRRIPFLLPLTTQCTMLSPSQEIYDELAKLEGGSGVAALSYTPGFPPADINECGPAVFAYADSQAAADGAADRLTGNIVAREAAFAAEWLQPKVAVQRAMQSNAPKPIVLADVQDNPGAGGTSDTTGLLRALVEMNAQNAAIGLLCDAAAAAAAHRAGEGAEIELSLGGKLFTDGDPPFTGRFVVEKLSDGRFLCTGPFYGGTRMQLGPMALLRIGGVRVVVSTERMQAADQDMFRHLGIEPTKMKILGLKSSVHFRADFQPIAEEVLVVDAPGAFVDKPAELPYRNLRKGIRLKPLGRAHGDT
jgi:microcystin degradation protein MlrC